MTNQTMKVTAVCRSRNLHTIFFQIYFILNPSILMKKKVVLIFRMINNNNYYKTITIIITKRNSSTVNDDESSLVYEAEPVALKDKHSEDGQHKQKGVQKEIEAV